MTRKETRRDNLFAFTRTAKPSRKDTVDRAELEKALAAKLEEALASKLEEGLASVEEAVERLAAKVDALTGKVA